MKRAFPLLGLLALGCESQSQPGAAAPSSRVEAIRAPTNQGSESDFCDVARAPADAPTLAFPPLEPAAPGPSASWRWINVWASWCSPCVEELPLVHKLRGQLLEGGAKVELLLLSVDQTAEAVTAFQREHGEAQPSLRLSDPKALEAWLLSVGLDAGATLPIHLFVDPQGKVRCARTGAIRDTDLPLIKKLVSG